LAGDSILTLRPWISVTSFWAAWAAPIDSAATTAASTVLENETVFAMV
jgi:hypothetical protein